MKPAILTDLTRCIGCEGCVWACKDINELPLDQTKKLSAYTWTVVERKSKVAVRRQCMHCEHPACVSVCPVGAMKKTDEGPVIWDKELCMGCRYCMIGCPFNMPKYTWDKTLPEVRKCIMCFEKKVSKGEEPACTAACPTGATVFGDRDKLLKEAKKRIADNPGRYVNHIYGEKEAGGTSVMYLSPVPFEQLGFKDVRDEDYPELTWAVLSRLPQVISVMGVSLAGIWWITHRRDEVARVEGKKDKSKKKKSSEKSEE